MLELNGFYNMDCLAGMREIPDKYFELAIVDPPYGGGHKPKPTDTPDITELHGGYQDWESQPRGRFGGQGGLFAKYKIEATSSEETESEKNGPKITHWDIAPDESYFKELARVSQNQIIWGGNNFPLPPTRCFVIWRKLTISEKFTMGMCEYAWTSFNANPKWIEIAPQDPERFHPTQKPVRLYEWLLTNYAKPGDKILDTHCGSASSLVACYNLGFEYVGFELDKDYYRMANERLEAVKSQLRLF